MSREAHSRERGQAAVEVVALLPLIALLVLGVAQALLALDSWGAAHEAARAGARAELVGVPARQVVSPRVLGARFAHAQLQVATTAQGAHRVRVRLAVPQLLPWVPGFTAQSWAQAAP